MAKSKSLIRRSGFTHDGFIVSAESSLSPSARSRLDVLGRDHDDGTGARACARVHPPQERVSRLSVRAVVPGTNKGRPMSTVVRLLMVAFPAAVIIVGLVQLNSLRAVLGRITRTPVVLALGMGAIVAFVVEGALAGLAGMVAPQRLLATALSGPAGLTPPHGRYGFEPDSRLGTTSHPSARPP